MERFLKGIIVGLGGVAPGLSGSVLLIIFGLYRQTLDAIGTLMKDFRKKIVFLLPLVCGMVLGVLLFSKLIDFLIHNYEMPTRFCFLGLILGTLPMVWKEVKRDGFSPKYYLLILAAAILGLLMFTANADAFPQVTNPNLLQCILLGVCVAATAIVPGVDPAVFLSTLGFYEMYVGALADLNFGILIPMVPGLALGAMGISFLMSQLFKRFYTGTYSVIFGIFLSMIPNMLTANCVLALNGASILSILLLLAGFLLSFWLGDLKQNNAAIRSWLEKRKRR